MSPPRRYSRFVSSVSLSIVFALLAFGRLNAGWQVESVESLLHGAVEAFAAQNYKQAAERFRRLHSEFGSDPAFGEARFLRRVLPLRGYAELRGGDPEEAVKHFRHYLDFFHSDPTPNAFVLYHLAIAKREAGRTEEALYRFREYLDAYPGRPEAVTALMQQMEILHDTQREAEARDVLERFGQSDAPPSLRAQARLMATRHALDNGRLETAAALLLDSGWDLDTVAELGALSAAALELGDRLLENGAAGDALRAYQQVLPRRILLDQKRGRLEALQARYHSLTPFQRRQGERLRHRLRSLEAAPDHTPAWTFRRGRAFLLAGRPREAWLIFESLALDEAMDTPLRKQAHFHWILAAHELKDWEEALTIARNFTRRYDDPALAPRAFYLIAEAHGEQRRHPEAIEVLTDLLDRFPDHQLAQRWAFTRGFNQAVLERYSEAREDFGLARDAYPETGLTARADLWIALTYFFEQNNALALREFDRLAETYSDHGLAGEILYRRATTLHAMGELTEALGAVSAFIADFPLHERHAEALALRGDIHLAEGEFDRALESFSAVPRDAGRMYPYAVFQIGRVHRARGDYEALTAHFRRYLDGEWSEPPPRTSEALYWIGWGYSRLERPEHALPLFLETLALYGDDREAAEIGTILTALADLHGNLPPGLAFQQSLPAGGRILLAASNFDDWLAIERRNAARDDKPTWHARLTLALSDRERAAGRPHVADRLLLDLAAEVPPQQLDAACLGRAGHHLRTRGLTAGETLLLRLLEDFPDAPEAAFAHYGLARLAHQAGDTENALLHVRRFRNRFPGHTLAVDATLLHAELHRLTGDTEAAREAYEEVLRDRSARGRRHADALHALATLYRDEGDPEKSIAYYQRIYTLYRAYPELVFEAYHESALLFERLNDPEAARATLREMLALDPGTGDPERLAAARRDLERLEGSLARTSAASGETERKALP